MDCYWDVKQQTITFGQEIKEKEAMFRRNDRCFMVVSGKRRQPCSVYSHNKDQLSLPAKTGASKKPDTADLLLQNEVRPSGL